MATPDVLAQLKDVDRELLPEYASALADMAPVIERGIAQLRQSPDDNAPVAGLFRVFHNLKGDAALCRFEFGLQVAHGLEALLTRQREGSLRFTPLLGEAILLAVDRLELTVEAVIEGKPLTHLRLHRLLNGLAALARANPGEVDALAARMIEDVSGFRPPPTGLAQGEHAPSAAPPAHHDRHGDLAFFRQLAESLEQRSPYFAGRTGRLLRLALAMNDSAGRPVDEVQLEAAVYLHDLGMMFLPETLWLGQAPLGETERTQLRRHPEQSAGLLMRMPGWEAAALMVAQHHEMPDGKGYPRGLAADEICPGAKILAIVDAFEAVMLKHGHRGQNLSLLRAAAEVNACEHQFATEWIHPFNQVVRKML